MKFAVLAVVMLACGVQSSYLPWGAAPHWGAAHWGGPVLATHAVAAPAISLSQGPAWGHYGGHYGAWGHPAAVSVSHGWAPHGAWGGHHASVAVHAPVHGHPHEGQYVAKTRGAVHTAPLAGHINSATSINVAPAPGTL